MYKTMIIGNLGHNNKYFDSTCSQCGGIYDSAIVKVCEKCGQTLIPITNSQGRKMAISEGSIYPLLSKEMKENQVKATDGCPNGMPIVHRFALFSFAGEDSIVPEHPLHKYLTSGRQIQLEVNHEPVAKSFTNKDGRLCCEFRHALITGHPYDDKITLLGQKTDEVNERVSTPAPSAPPANAEEIASLKAQIEQMEKRLGMGQPQAREVGSPTELQKAVQEAGLQQVETPGGPVQCEFFDATGSAIV